MSKVTEALVSQAKKTKDVDMEVTETCNMIAFKDYHRNTHHEGGQEGNGSDEEEDGHGHGGGQRVRCAQQ